jgi:hypothetical protein
MVVAKFIAWVAQIQEIERFAEQLVAPAVSAYSAFIIPLKMFPSRAGLASIVLSCCLVTILGTSVGWAWYGLSRSSALAALWGAVVVIAASYSHLSKIVLSPKVEKNSLTGPTDAGS